MLLTQKSRMIMTHRIICNYQSKTPIKWSRQIYTLSSFQLEVYAQWILRHTVKNFPNVYTLPWKSSITMNEF